VAPNYNDPNWLNFTLEIEALGDAGHPWAEYRQRVDELVSRWAASLDPVCLAEQAAFSLSCNALCWDESAPVVMPLVEAYLSFPISPLRRMQVLADAIRWARRSKTAPAGFEVERHASLVAIAVKLDGAARGEAANIIAQLARE
jgi:hypothetical protein